jgi:uncharacterized protein YheU (UPF0270 family)
MSDAAQEPVDVPYTELPADLLQAVIESFVLREGTDYGEKELSLEDKVARVITQLKRGEAKIVFDPESASVTIVVGHRRIDGAPGR